MTVYFPAFTVNLHAKPAENYEI